MKRKTTVENIYNKMIEKGKEELSVWKVDQCLYNVASTARGNMSRDVVYYSKENNVYFFKQGLGKAVTKHKRGIYQERGIFLGKYSIVELYYGIWKRDNKKIIAEYIHRRRDDEKKKGNPRSRKV